VDGVAFSGSHVSTGIKLGFDSSAERCFVKNCTVGIETKASCTGAVARNCEMNACGTSGYIRGARSGFEACDSTSHSVAALQVDAAIAGIVSRNNSWDVPVTLLASDFSSTLDGNYSNVTGLTLNLVANVTYDIEFAMPFTCLNTTGIKLSMAGGTATFSTSIKPRVVYSTLPTTAVSDADWATSGEAPLDTVGPTEGFVTVRHVVTCSGSGTLIPRLAQSSSGATATVLKAGSWAMVTVL
jgi:hypothetical protein